MSYLVTKFINGRPQVIEDCGNDYDRAQKVAFDHDAEVETVYAHTPR